MSDDQDTFNNAVMEVVHRARHNDPSDLVAQARNSGDVAAERIAHRASEMWADILVEAAALEAKRNAFDAVLATLHDMLDEKSYVASSPTAEFSDSREGESNGSRESGGDDDEYVPQRRG